MMQKKRLLINVARPRTADHRYAALRELMFLLLLSPLTALASPHIQEAFPALNATSCSEDGGLIPLAHARLEVKLLLCHRCQGRP